MYTSGSCSSGFRTFFPGSRLVYSLFLGVDVELGGVRTVTTCGVTRNNTVLYVGTGPTWSQPFGCIAGSALALPATQRNYFIQVRVAGVVAGILTHIDGSN